MIGYTIPKLSRYKMWYTADLEVTHQPNIEGIDPEYIGDELKSPIVDNISITFFVFPRRIVILIITLVLVGFITKALRKRMREANAKKIHEQEEFKHRQEEHDHDHTTETPTPQS